MDINITKYTNIQSYILLVGLSFLLVFTNHYLFVSDNTIYLSVKEQLPSEQIDKMLESVKKLEWLGYVLIPFVLLLRVGFTSICLYTGNFIANIKTKFRDLFKVALLADFAFVAAGFAKLVILIFFKEVNTLTDLQFQPLSLMELLNKNAIDLLFVYPVSLINVFELLYWLALARLLTSVVNQSFGKSLKMVASSYGTGLLLWVLFVMFLTVNFGS